VLRQLSASSRILYSEYSTQYSHLVHHCGLILKSFPTPKAYRLHTVLFECNNLPLLFSDKSHTLMVVRKYCKDDDRSQWGMAKLDPHHHHLQTPQLIITKRWVHDYIADICKILSSFARGVSFLLMRDFLYHKLRGYFFIFVGSFQSPTAKTPTLILMQNTSTDADMHKDVPFWGHKTKI